MRTRQRLGIALIIAALITGGVVWYLNAERRQVQPVFAVRTELSALWSKYKDTYMEDSSGRILDKSQNSITTSEGESYALLRAVWEDDQATFDKTLKFANDNMKHDNDELFAWKFGQLSDGSYGVLTDEGGNNIATDGDEDIALALIFAANRWQESSYLDQAKALVKDIWRYEVVTVDGKPYVVANNLERSDPDHVLINPSYLSPASYRLFAKLDASHNWMGVVNSSYELLDNVTNTTLVGQTSKGLPPDWIELNRKTGALEAPTGVDITTDFSYDAMRVPFRLALDHKWNDEDRAKQVLQKLSYLKQQWQANGLIKAGYTQAGTVTNDYESPAIYGGIIGYFIVADPDDAANFYNYKLQSLYSSDTQAWSTLQSYYDDNWAWFGIALYNNALPNLAD